MGLNIGNVLLTQAGSVLTVNPGTGPMGLLSSGGVSRPKQCQFIATGDPAGVWNNFVNAAFNVMTYPTVIVNANACYNGTSRFTAPVDGIYLFQASDYIIKDSAAAYFHSVFGVNGSNVGNNVNSAYPNYRIAGHGWTTVVYEDTHITEVFDLNAGDYVEHMVYSTGTPTNRYYGAYTRFTGFLLG